MASLCAEGDVVDAAAAAAADDGLHDVMEAFPEFDPGKEVSYNDLQLFTNNFSKENKIGRTQFGLLYRGTVPQGWKGGIDDERAVTVKMWETKSIGPNGKFFHVKPEYILARMKDEIRFLGLPSLQSNPFVGKVEAYCFEENKLGVVYDVKPLDTIYNIIRDEDKFGWRNRVKVALGLARFLSFCHGNAPKYLVRNLSAAHVIVDQEFNPVLVDFAMILGGGIGDDRAPESCAVPLTSYGYLDCHIILCGVWTNGTDVYTFGVILLELIMKHTSRQVALVLKENRPVSLADAAVCYYEKQLAEAKNGKVKCLFPTKRKKKVKCSFVHECLRDDPDFDADDGTELTRLAVSCFAVMQYKRPSMEEIICELEKLHVIVKHAGMP
ncbi:hypothetical protein BUALT_BualtUnG0035700 [Buddleja alternifolia]|uniref:Protein kinase domain-containing protein n=1 Tax=Buddleja alternifolia TaxID=168488 RepID=A0AAV6W0C2_9LAMI|nr:hypothetical protein BUALT_BualtUnG0035700 [Buddleja alternifolia]